MDMMAPTGRLSRAVSSPAHVSDCGKFQGNSWIFWGLTESVAIGKMVAVRRSDSDITKPKNYTNQMSVTRFYTNTTRAYNE